MKTATQRCTSLAVLLALLSIPPAASQVQKSLKLTSPASAQEVGEPVRLVTQATQPSQGRVVFYDGTTILGYAVMDRLGRAELQTHSLLPGPHFISAAVQGHRETASAGQTVTITGEVSEIEERRPYLLAADLKGTGVMQLIRVSDSGVSVASRLIFQGAALAVAVGDFNEDGHNDLLIATPAGLLVLRGDGLGGFADPQLVVPFDTSVSAVTGLVVSDFNEDGHPDVAIGKDGKTVIYFGDGKDGLTGAVTYADAALTAGEPVGDLNGDHHADLLLLDAKGQFRALLGNGAGGFSPQPFGLSGFSSAETGVRVHLADRIGNGIVNSIAVAGQRWERSATTGLFAKAPKEPVPATKRTAALTAVSGTPKQAAAPIWGTTYFGQMITLAGSGDPGSVAHASGQGYTSTGGGYGGDNGPGTGPNVRLNLPSGMDRDSTGNIYFVDTRNCRLRKIFLSNSATNGYINTLVDDTNPLNAHGLCGPLGASIGIAVDRGGNVLFPDASHNVVWSVPGGGGAITIAAGVYGVSKIGSADYLSYPSDVKLDAGSKSLTQNLYILDANQIKVPSQGIIYGMADNGSTADNIDASIADLGSMTSISVSSGGDVYLASGCRVRLITHSTGVVKTLAGTGTCGYSGEGGLAASAGLAGPISLTVDLNTGNLFVAEGTGNIRKITYTNTGAYISTVGGPEWRSTFTGEGGPVYGESLSNPQGLVLDGSGNLYFSDWGHNRIRFVNFTSPVANAANSWGTATGGINLVAGNGPSGLAGDGGPALGASIGSPVLGIAVDGTGNIYFSDNANYAVRKVSGAAVGTVPAGTITRVMGTGLPGTSVSGGLPTTTQLQSPKGLAIDGAGNLYVADSSALVWRIKNNVATIFAGGGASLADGIPATSAQLGPNGLEIDSSGNLYIADQASHRIRKVDVLTNQISTVAGGGTPVTGVGDGGPATSASLLNPTDVKVDSAGNLIINDISHARIRKVAKSTGIITTIAGNGTVGYVGDNGPATSATISSGHGGLALDAADNIYFLQSSVDSTAAGAARVRKVDGFSGVITTVAGPGTAALQAESPYLGDGGAATDAVLGEVEGLATDRAGNVYFGNRGHIRIVNFQPPTYSNSLSS